MRFDRSRISQYILYDTGVENIFISEYMVKAPENCVKAYLLGLMYAQLGEAADDAVMARTLGLTAAGLTDCWRYWEKEGLLKRTDIDGEMQLEFVSLREQAFGMPGAEPAPKKEPSDAQAAALYGQIEELTGTLLSPQEISEIRSWLSVLGMSASFILEGYNYCLSRGKGNSYRYVAAVLKDWQAKGLCDVQGVREYLAQTDRHADLHRKIFRAMGFKYSPTAEQVRLMDSWADDMGWSEEKILEACNKSAGIANPNIRYVDSVLRGWYEESRAPAAKAGPDLLAEVQTLYRKDREENEKKTEERRARIFAQIPRLRQLEEEIKDASFRASRAMFAGANGKAVVAGQKKRIEMLNEEKTALLRDAGYSETALNRSYTCSLCKDTGELEDGSRCSCFNTKLSFVQSGLIG